MPLNQSQKLHLRSLGRRLDAQARVGREAISDALVSEVGSLLEHNELVKVRFVAHKEERRALSKELALKCNAELVDVVGHVAVLYRAAKDPKPGGVTAGLPD